MITANITPDCSHTDRVAVEVDLDVDGEPAVYTVDAAVVLDLYATGTGGLCRRGERVEVAAVLADDGTTARPLAADEIAALLARYGTLLEQRVHAAAERC